MRITTLTSRALNQDVSSAKRAAKGGPVIITDRGRPSHVLMTYEAFERLTGRPETLLEGLAMPGLSDIAFDVPRARIAPRGIDLA